MMRIAYLEDDPDQAALVARWLRSAGHECMHFGTGAALLEGLGDPLPDLLLLDWQLPDLSGEAVMSAVRARYAPDPPIVFLTAHDESNDVLRVLEAGANDHLLKPVNRDELLCRVDAFASVVAADAAAGVFAPYSFDRVARTVTLRERPVNLDDAEFDVALSLFESAGRIVTLPTLAKHAARASGAEQSTRSAQGCVARVRAKLRLTPASGWQLRTVTDVGFRFEPLR